jgi:hypothetical protein
MYADRTIGNWWIFIHNFSFLLSVVNILKVNSLREQPAEEEDRTTSNNTTVIQQNPWKPT